LPIKINRKNIVLTEIKNTIFEYMNTDQVVEYLRTQNKPYEYCEPRMAQSTFSNTLRAIKTGTAKLNTIKSFMERLGFGYVDTHWIKK
jgi:hypothetical protein